MNDVDLVRAYVYMREHCFDHKHLYSVSRCYPRRLEIAVAGMEPRNRSCWHGESARRGLKGPSRVRGLAEYADWARTGADCGWRAKARTRADRADSRGLARTGGHVAQATPPPLSGNRHTYIHGYKSGYTPNKSDWWMMFELNYIAMTFFVSVTVFVTVI